MLYAFAQAYSKIYFNVFHNLSQHLTNIFRHTTMFILMLATLVYCIIQGYQSIMITLIQRKKKNILRHGFNFGRISDLLDQQLCFQIGGSINKCCLLIAKLLHFEKIPFILYNKYIITEQPMRYISCRLIGWKYI